MRVNSDQFNDAMTASNKQPRALIYLFMTELWERFSYWSVQSLMVLYMTESLGLKDSRSYLIFGAFGALMMATPVIGGYIADTLIGYKRAVMLGACFLLVGYLGIATGHELGFYLGMSSCIIGNGLLKPNISTLLGTCYSVDDHRRESGFTWFYFGINSGAILGTISCGIIAKFVSYQWAFTLAAGSMLIGLLVFSFGKRQISKDQLSHASATQQTPKSINLKCLAVIIGSALLIAGLYFCLLHPDVANSLLAAFGAALLITLAVHISRTEPQLRPRFIVAIVLTLLSIGFWALYMQMPMSMTLFVARAVDLHIFGLHIPPSTVSSLNSFFILLFAPLTVQLWNGLKRRNSDLSYAGKFCLALILIGLGFIALWSGALTVTGHHKASLWWVVLGYLGLTLGELSLSPIGLAMITLYSPPKLRGLMMGTWFYALAASTAIAGELAKLASVPKAVDSLTHVSHIYSHAFLCFAGICFATGIVLLLLCPSLKKLAN